MLSEIKYIIDSKGCFTLDLRSLLSGLASSRKILSNVIKTMRLTLNKYHRKLKDIGNISDQLISTDVLGFYHPYYTSEWLYGCTVLELEESFTFIPPTTTCCLPQLPAASHNYLLPPTTTFSLPRLPAAFHDYLLPPTATAAFHDYLLPTFSPSLRLLRERPEILCLKLLLQCITT